MKKKRVNALYRAKIEKIMTRMKLLLLILLIGVQGLYAKAWSQNERLSFEVRNLQMENFLEMLQSKVNVTFVYNHEDLLTYQASGKFKDSQLTQILDEVFTGLPFKYEIIQDRIVISRKQVEAQQAPQVNLMKVSGTVKDAKGETLPGVAVRVKGTTKGVATDVDGNYKIEVIKGQTLEFTYIGMMPQTIVVGDKTTIDVILKENQEDLEEVAVVAFGKQKKSSVVGSISTVKPSELKVPSSNLTTALAGRIAGMISYQTSGEPGEDNAQFFIRGIGSFGSGKIDPLILIDNIEMTSDDLARLQPDDIASFSIMKDATAASLYGSRGANGVILVTTKEGIEGAARISIRFETSMSRPTRQVELADPITYMKLHNEAVRTRDPLGILPYSEEKIANTLAGSNPMVYPATDWFDMLFKDYTMNERLNFSISGGGKVARYYLSGTFNQDNGILKVDGKNNFNNNINIKRYVIRSNTNINLTKTTELIVRVHGTFDDYSGPLDGGTLLYNRVINTNPVLFPAVYQPDEANRIAKQILFGNYGDGGYLNPYADMVKGYKEYATSMMLAQIEAKQKLNFITEGLSFRLLANTNRYAFFDVKRSYKPYFYSLSGYDKYTDKYTLKSLNEGDEGLSYNEGEKDINSAFYFETAVDYVRTFNEKHAVGGMLVLTARSQLNGNAGDLQSSLPYRNMGLAGRFTYGYDNRYFAELNFGYNGSERFAKNERWGFFPSVGAGWLISNEPFYQDKRIASLLTKLKLKATYGLVGNDAIGEGSDRFFYLSNVNTGDGGKGMGFGTNLDYSKPGISISRYGNPAISWETAHKTNLGIEIGLWGKVDIAADVFWEYRNNILMKRAFIPPTMGLQVVPKANVGEAKGRGTELSVDYNESFYNGLWVTGRATFTYARNEYLTYEEPDYALAGKPWMSAKGNSVRQEWGYVAERLFVDEYDIKNSPKQIFGSEPVMGGDIKYKDIDGDGVISNTDRVPIGFPSSPEIIYGFGFSAGYKGFDLSCFFQGSARSSFWIDPSATSPFINGQTALLKVYADDHWSEENRNLNALWPRLSERRIGNNMERSTWFMRNGSFLRLKSAELGYTLPAKLTQKIRMDKLRVYLSGTNLLTFSKFKLWDVEMGGNGLGYPVQMVLNGGIQINF